MKCHQRFQLPCFHQVIQLLSILFTISAKDIERKTIVFLLFTEYVQGCQENLHPLCFNQSPNIDQSYAARLSLILTRAGSCDEAIVDTVVNHLDTLSIASKLHVFLFHSVTDS